MAEKKLSGRVALITGGGRGIGRAIAIAFAREGARVVVSSRTAEQVEKTVAVIRAEGNDALGIAADLTIASEADRLINQIESEYDQLDLVFLNAGGNSEGARGGIEEVDSAAWVKTIECNLYTAYHVAKASIRLLKNSPNGQILTMGSGMGRRPSARSSAYSASKAALWMFTRSLAVELAPYGITANELIPGPVRSNASDDEPFTPHLIDSGEWENEWMKRPDDVTPLALFLATQGNTGPSGQSFALNRRLI